MTCDEFRKKFNDLTSDLLKSTDEINTKNKAKELRELVDSFPEFTTPEDNRIIRLRCHD